MNSLSILLAPVIICFFTATSAAVNDHEYLIGDVSINCGSTENFATVDGREWIGDRHKKVSSSLQIKGSSTSSSIAGESIVSADQAQYKTARISRSQFSYTFHLNPGQKLIRLHFNPVSYRGFNRFKDLFTVEAGPFILLGKFSASLTADALGGNGKYFAKEFLLSQTERHDQLPWRLYFNLIVGIAQGVCCLHQNPDFRRLYCKLEPRCKHSPSKQHLDLITLVRKLRIEGRALDLVGASMGIEFSSEEATRCVKIALLCTQFDPQHRPDISFVLGALHGDQELALELRLREAMIL